MQSFDFCYSFFVSVPLRCTVFANVLTIDLHFIQLLVSFCVTSEILCFSMKRVWPFRLRVECMFSSCIFCCYTYGKKKQRISFQIALMNEPKNSAKDLSCLIEQSSHTGFLFCCCCCVFHSLLCVKSDRVLLDFS